MHIFRLEDSSLLFADKQEYWATKYMLSHMNLKEYVESINYSPFLDHGFSNISLMNDSHNFT
jgi:hypothetical protein